MQVISAVVQEHVEGAAAQRNLRSRLVRAPHVQLRQLLYLDDRLVANLDGIALADEYGWSLCRAMVADPSVGALFAAGVCALERPETRLESILAVAEAVPDGERAVLSAFGWMEPARLRGLVVGLLMSPSPARRRLGVGACAVHRVDPGLARTGRLEEQDPIVRARAFRAVGECGCRDLLPPLTAASRDEDAACRFWAVWSAVLLGNRGSALETLGSAALTDGGDRETALALALQAMTLAASHRVLQTLAARPHQQRRVIRGSGIAGDPSYVPWLIQRMEDPVDARMAGEAFTLVTGADLAALNLEAARPETFEVGPNDDPSDANVDTDPDDGLPWPDPVKVQRWWAEHASRFAPGQRYFMGAPVTREHCIAVLKSGYQRQRILAAHHLCLLEPGTPLFNTSAPAWRQQRLLAEMH